MGELVGRGGSQGRLAGGSVQARWTGEKCSPVCRRASRQGPGAGEPGKPGSTVWDRRRLTWLCAALPTPHTVVTTDSDPAG